MTTYGKPWSWHAHRWEQPCPAPDDDACTDMTPCTRCPSAVGLLTADEVAVGVAGQASAWGDTEYDDTTGCVSLPLPVKNGAYYNHNSTTLRTDGSEPLGKGTRLLRSSPTRHNREEATPCG